MDQPLKPRRPRSVRRIIFYASLALILFLIGMHFLWGVLANYSLNRAIGVLHAKGEPTTPADLKLDSVPDEKNASLDYRAAGEAVDTTAPLWKMIDQSSAGEFDFPFTDAELQTVHELVAAYPGALSLTASARGKIAGGWHDDFSHPTFLSANIQFNTARNLARLLRFAAIDAHAQHDDALTIVRLNDELSLANAAQLRPALIGHLVALGTDSMASKTITSIATDLHVKPNSLERQVLADLLHHLQDETGFDDGNKFGYRTERLATLYTLRDLSDGTVSLNNLSVAQPGLLVYLLRPTIRDDARISLSYFQDVMAAGNAPDWPAAKKIYPVWYAQKIDGLPWLHMTGQMLVPGLNRAIQTGFQIKTDRRLAVVAVAARLYAADHHDRLPDSLSQLIPDYLPSIPTDPMSGNPLLFKSDPPRVYSVGDDGKDDGGIPSDQSTPKSRRPPSDTVVYLTPHPRGYPFNKKAAPAAPKK